MADTHLKFPEHGRMDAVCQGHGKSGKRAGDIVKINAPGDNYTIEIIEIMD